MTRIAFPLLCALLAMPAAIAQSSAPALKSRPDADEKKCLAAQRRVERQKEVVTDVDARLAKDRIGREACKTKRACDRLDRGLKASETRKTRYDKELAQYDAEAKLACIKP